MVIAKKAGAAPTGRPTPVAPSGGLGAGGPVHAARVGPPLAPASRGDELEVLRIELVIALDFRSPAVVGDQPVLHIGLDVPSVRIGQIRRHNDVHLAADRKSKRLNSSH